MIQRFAPRARRAHDDLVLPDASGTPVSLKSLFDAPRDLMAALIRGGWIIPGEPDRSMFLIAIIGTGPMQDILGTGRYRPANGLGDGRRANSAGGGQLTGETRNTRPAPLRGTTGLTAAGPSSPSGT